MIIVTGQCAMLCGTLACMVLLVSITSLFENSLFNIIQICALKIDVVK